MAMLFCKNYTNSFVLLCSRDFCARCHEIHSTNLSVNYHDVLNREKLLNFSKDEVCTIHPDGYFKLYCQTCEVPICNLCTRHRKRLSQDARTAYEQHRLQCKNCIRIIRNVTIFNRQVLLSGVRMDFKTSQTFFFSKFQTKLVEKA